MKRVFKQKNEPVLSRSVKPSEASAQLPNHRFNVVAAASSEGPRRTRTSAAMLGLAISVSATGMLLPGRNHKAVAAEPMAAEQAVEESSLTIRLPEVKPTPPNSSTTIKKKQVAKQTSRVVKQVKPPAPSLSEESQPSPPRLNLSSPVTKKATPTQPSAQAPVSTPRNTFTPANEIVIEHKVQQGETLWNISQEYAVQPDAIAASSDIETKSILSIGQRLQIPSTNTEPVLSQSNPEQVTSQSNLDRVLKNRQDAAIDNLEQHREQLRDSLANLRSQENEQFSTQQQEDLSASLAPQINNINEDYNQALTSESTAEESVLVEVPQPENTQEIPGSASGESTQELPGKSVVIPLQIREPGTEATRQVLELAIPKTHQAIDQINDSDDSTAVVIPQHNHVESEVYQVKPGDTLSEIASQYGVSHTQIIQNNDINNPHLLGVNQQLKIPKVQAEGNQNPDTWTSSGSPNIVLASTNGGDTPKENESQQHLPVDSSFSETETLLANNSLQQRSEESSNPYVEKLKADVLRMREEYRRQQQEQESEGVTIPVPVTPSINSTLSAPNQPEVVNSEWQEEGNSGGENPLQEEARTQELPSTPESNQQQVIATAPMPVESYNPLINTPVGEVVSPDLPPLQSPDEYLPTSPDQFNGYIWPTKGVLTSGYGWRWGRMHKGIDVAAPVGTPIYAAAPGEVIYAGWNSGGYGNLVKIRHPDGSVTLYAHNSRINVRRGQLVKQGQKIAAMGSTGFSTGPHLHFEVHPSGRGAVNPMAMLPARN